MAASKTQKSNTRKKSTAKGNVSGKKKTAGRPSTRKNVNTKQSISSGFQTEIVILVLIAASIILMVSCLGFGGSVGGSISRALMGVMGLMAYAFPFVLFGVSVFLISNKGNVLAYKKTAAAAVLFLVLCGVFQLLTEGYAESTTLAEYYKVSSQYHTRRHWRSHLHFYHFRIWNGRSLCDHCACDLSLPDFDHPAFFSGISL